HERIDQIVNRWVAPGGSRRPYGAPAGGVGRLPRTSVLGYFRAVPPGRCFSRLGVFRVDLSVRSGRRRLGWSRSSRVEGATEATADPSASVGMTALECEVWVGWLGGRAGPTGLRREVEVAYPGLPSWAIFVLSLRDAAFRGWVI